MKTVILCQKTENNFYFQKQFILYSFFHFFSFFWIIFIFNEKKILDQNVINLNIKLKLKHIYMFVCLFCLVSIE